MNRYKNRRFPRIGCFLLALPLIALAPAACVSSGSSGSPREALSTISSIARETSGAVNRMESALSKLNEEEATSEDGYYIGRAVGANILTIYPPWERNPGLTAYLNKICAAIVINSPQPELYAGYHVMILDSPEINAFATPGGHIFLTRGIVASAASEDALAAVIAHEAAHIQLQHSLDLINNLRLLQNLTEVADTAADIASRALSQERKQLFSDSVRELVNTMIRNGYSQAQEFDADKTALSLMASAGYNPVSFSDMLSALDRAQAKTPGGFNTTHPSPRLRLANVERNLRSYRVEDTRIFRKSRFEAAAPPGLLSN
ncbi:MAG: M48 family metallopeptidase [Spirochaetaceae bacterium]|jgi:predicted Zn-dependent protease|nr:M48 family metallopeptidase [Spirochaetaceae bacterium]